MRFDVRLTQGAELDLEALYDWTARNRSRVEADALLVALVSRTEALAEFPLRGSVPKELEALGIADFRQLLLSPYLIIYRMVGEAVFIMVIADGRPICRRCLSGGS